MTRLFTLVALLAALLIASPAQAGYPLAKGGEIFTQAVGRPDKPVVTGPVTVAVFRAKPENDYLYLWLNGTQLFDRSGTVWNNGEYSLEWLTTTKARPQIWNWTIPDKVTQVVVGHGLYQSAQRTPSLYMMALATFSKAVVLLRRQIELVALQGFKLDNNIHVDETVSRFLKWRGQAKLRSRLEAVVYLPNPEKLWQTGAKAVIKVGPYEDNINLPLGEAQRREAIVAASIAQEKKLSREIKELLTSIVAPQPSRER